MRPQREALLAAILACLALAGCHDAARDRGDDDAASEASPSAVGRIGEEAGIILDSTTVQRMGLRTALLLAATRAPELDLAAMVVNDPGAEITLRAGVGGRVSEVEGRPWPRLGERIAAGEVIARVGDASPLAAPRAGTVARVTSQPGELVQAGQELLALVDYSAPLVQVAWSEQGESGPPAEVVFAIPGTGRRYQGRLIGVAPEADRATLGPAILYRVGGAPLLRPGMALTARVPDPGSPRRGVLVPSAAVVQWDALTWAYVERAPGRYVRVQIPTDWPVAGGWLVATGLEPGTRVVTAGAVQLLSEEFRARIVVGEEVGE